MHPETQQTIFAIAGMHRSGTSLTAALLQSAGVNIGEILLGATESNVKGHFENVDFFNFHRMVFRSEGINDAGWTLTAIKDIEEQYIDLAKEIIAKNSQNPIWGWKDPRTTLFLDFWAELLPQAKFIFVYRLPWEVVDSLYRRGGEFDVAFLEDPDLAVKLWIYYNQKVIEFYDKLPERCILTSVYDIAAAPEKFVETINTKFQVELATPAVNIYEQSLLNLQVDTPRAALITHYFPQTREIYAELNARATVIDKEKILSIPTKSLQRKWAFQDWLEIHNLNKKIKIFKLESEQLKAQLQSQLQLNQAELQQTRVELQLNQTELKQAGVELRQTQFQIQQIKTAAEQWQFQVKQVQAELQHAQEIVTAMLTSKFWQLRTLWLRLRKPIKAFIGLEDNELLSFEIPSVQLNNQFVTSNLLQEKADVHQQLVRHTATADVIVYIHSGLDASKLCLESLISYSTAPHSLILIDDGTDQETHQYLTQFASSQGSVLIQNAVALGYAVAINQGLQQSQADYVFLVDSDTVVTPDWLDRMIACGESDPQIGVVAPLSNTADQLPAGVTAADMSKIVAQYSGYLYPRVLFLNRFCLMLKRQVTAAVGYFDEAIVSSDNRSEVDDYCLRARYLEWQLAIADDAYVYHTPVQNHLHEDRILQGIRAWMRVATTRQQMVTDGRRWQGKRVLFILPIVGAGGGGNVVFQEATAMQRMGVDVKILNFTRHRATFELGYPENSLPIVYVETEADIPEILSDFDAAIATLYSSVDWLKPILPHRNFPVRGYYVQDFEPYFFTKNSKAFKIAWNSYTRYPDLIRFTKTEWNRHTVKEQIGVDCAVVGASVNLDLYRPRQRRDQNWPERALRIAAMIRPDTRRRNPQLTMEVLRQLRREHGDSVEIILFGCRSNDPSFLALPHNFNWSNAGILTRPQLAFLLNEVDIFVDFSSFQAMGLTAMEAMACGVAVIVPENGGASTFARHNENSLIVDTSSSAACLAALQRLVIDDNLRTQLQKQAITDICQYFPEKVAHNILSALF